MSDPGQRPDQWIDAVIHAPARLQIVMQLFVIDAADATFLLNRTGLTWGNLSTHISKLEEAGYVSVEKAFQGKKPRTMIRLTNNGRTAFETYRSKMQEALSDPGDA
jgi:DNA-binding MarR family transcriptional regulator